MSEVFRIEVGNAAAGEGLLAEWRSKIKNIFARNQYRFRISEAPVLANPGPWGQPGKLAVPKATLELLAFQFPPSAELQTIGKDLASSIFQGSFIDLFARSIITVSQQNKALRVMFSYNKAAHPLIRSVPWECVFYPILAGQEQHFGLSKDLGVARFISLGDLDVYQPLEIQDKLRVLAVAPNPQTCATPLGVTAELIVMSEIAAQHKEEIDFNPLPNAQWSEFENELARVDPHILFFTGHGGFVNKVPHLFFQKPDGACEPITTATFANKLRPHTKLRLVILSACQTGVARNPFASAAEELIEIGVPAVIAMQSKVDDIAAREFGLRFFQYLFHQKYSIDACINAGRAAMFDIRRTKTEWAVPVLYLSTRKDQIFDFSPSSEINSAESIKRSSMEEKFPLTVEPFIPRPALSGQFDLDASDKRLTVISGGFGAGKTQITSKFCTERIRARKPFLFFYVECRDDWTAFDSVLVELDRQTRNLGFQGFRKILDDMPRYGAEDSIRAFSELLAAQNLVIVFDDYVWNGPDFWRDLFIRLANHLRRSKVFVITSSEQYAGLGEYSLINVTGFTPDEAREFFSNNQGAEPPPNEESIAEMMTVANGVSYFPWYMKIIKDTFHKEYGRLAGNAPLSVFLDKIDERVSGLERRVLQQLSVLRQPITLQGLALMLEPTAPSEYLKAAYALQQKSLLNFTRNLGVELQKELQQHYTSNMTAPERKEFHERAAIFYERQAKAIMADEERL